MSACVQLFSLASLQPAEESKEQSADDAALRAEINQAALQRLEEQFKACQRLAPVVVIGSSGCGKSFLLDRLVGLATEAHFKAFREFNGAIAYPVPVQIGPSELLLIEMSGIDFDGEGQESLLTMEVLRALLSVASVCIICLEKTSKTFANITKIMQIYEDLHQHSGLSISKFFVCVESEKALSANPLKNGYRDFSRGRFMGICEFFYRGNPGFDENEYRRMIGMLSLAHFHNEFQLTHERYRRSLQERSISGSPTRIQAIIASLQTLGKLANSAFKHDWTLQVSQVKDPSAKTVACSSSKLQSTFQSKEKKNMSDEQVDVVRNESMNDNATEIRDCVQLVSFSGPFESDEKRASDADLKVTLDEEKLARLKERFNGCERLIPVLVIGNSGCGKSIILDKIVGQSGNHSVASFKGRFSGVLTCPEPVEMGSYQFLLMEMSGMDFIAQDEEGVLKKKTLHALLSVTSVCIICLEKSSMFASISEIMKIYEGMRSKSKLQLSKFFICVESEESLSTLSGYTAFRRENYMNICEFFYRGNPGFDENEFQRMIRKISLESFHSQFEDSHRLCQAAFRCSDMPGPLSHIKTISIILETLLILSKTDFTLEKHIATAPDFTSELAVQKLHIDEITQLIKKIENIEALPFFKKAEYTVDINPDVIKILEANYLVHEPVVVVTFFGHQGIGKSTFINTLVQYLLGTRVRKMICKEGNTRKHTTTDSYVLSQPLKLLESTDQLMFVDLEGLGGIETLRGAGLSNQANLISRILAITSVYCIFVRNEKNIISFISEQLHQINFLKRTYQFKVECIFLLFHDKDIDVEVNPDLAAKVNEWNLHFFSGEKVIKIMNKPNFNEQGKAEMYKQFLTNFLADIDHPKKRQNGAFMNIFDMLSCMALISTSHSGEDLSSHQLSAEEEKMKEEIVNAKKREIEEAFQKAECEDAHYSLVQTFTTAAEYILASTITDLGSPTSALSKHIRAALETEKTAKRIQLIEIENFFNAIQRLNLDEIKAQITASLNFAYRANTMLRDFSRTPNKMRARFEYVRERYKFKKSEIFEILEHLNTLENNLRLWYRAELVGYVGLTIVSVSSPAGVGSLALDLLRSGLVSARFIADETIQAKTILTPFLAFVGIGRAGTAGTFWKLSGQKAYPLYDELLQVNLLQQPALEKLGSSEGAVLLIVGRKKMNISLFLNEFIRWTFPFDVDCQNAFNDKKRIQTLMFPKMEYQADTLGSSGSGNHKNIFRFGVIIYIRMKKKIETEKARRLSMLTATLMTKASLTYFFTDSTEESRDSIANVMQAYHPQDVRSVRVISDSRMSYEALFRDKQLDFKQWNMMNISQAETLWRDNFSILTRELFNTTTITTLQLRDVLTQAKDFYLQSSALPLFEERIMAPIRTCNEFIQSLTDSHAEKKMAFVLVVGRKNMQIPNFLNGFMKSTFPLAGDYQDAFNDKKRFQVHHFRLLVNPEEGQQSLRQGVLVYIRMKKKTETLKAEKLATMTAMFLAKSSLALFFLESTEETKTYLSSVFVAYQPRPEVKVKAWIIVPSIGMKSTDEVNNLLQGKHITPDFKPMNISKSEDTWKENFPHLKEGLSKQFVTPQEVKDIVIQGQRCFAQDSAFDLFQEGKFSPLGFIDSVITSSKDSTQYREEMGILLMIGRKRMDVPDTINRFLQSVYSVYAPKYFPFNDKTRIQAMTVFVRSANQENKQIVRQILVLYLRMKSKSDKPKAQKLAEYAAALISISTITCFFLDSIEEPEPYLLNILRKYQPRMDEERKACILMTRNGDMENLNIQFREKSIEIINAVNTSPCQYDLFQQFLYNLVTGKSITPQEGKTILAQTQRFYKDETAVELSTKTFLMSDSLTINEKFMQILDDLPPSEDLVILLAIGWNQVQANLFLNSFMQSNYSILGPCCNAFNNSTLIQAFNFPMFNGNPESPKLLTKVLMLYIKMDEKTEKVKTEKLAKFAVSMISPSVLPCLFFSPEEKANPDIMRISNAAANGKNHPAWVILSPHSAEAVEGVNALFSEKNVNVQPMNFFENEETRGRQFQSLTREILKLAQLSPSEVNAALAKAFKQANEVS